METALKWAIAAQCCASYRSCGFPLWIVYWLVNKIVSCAAYPTLQVITGSSSPRNDNTTQPRPHLKDHSLYVLARLQLFFTFLTAAGHPYHSDRATFAFLINPLSSLVHTVRLAQYAGALSHSLWYSPLP